MSYRGNSCDQAENSFGGNLFVARPASLSPQTELYWWNGDFNPSWESNFEGKKRKKTKLFNSLIDEGVQDSDVLTVEAEMWVTNTTEKKEIKTRHSINPELTSCRISSQGSYGFKETWTVMKFNNFLFQAWKIVEFNCQSWKVTEN